MDINVIDGNNIDKLTPDQRKMWEQLQSQFPTMRSKMDTSRELNTPTAQEKQAAAPRRPPEPHKAADNGFDYSALQPTAFEPASREAVPQVKIDERTQNMYSSFTDTDGVTKSVEEERQREEQQKLREERKKHVDPNESPEAALQRRVDNFSPEGKVHPILAKLKKSLRMDQPKIPYTVEIEGVTYELEELDRGRFTQARNLAVLHSADDLEYTLNLDVAAVAVFVTRIDGAEVCDVFEVPTEQDGAKLSVVKRRELGMQELYDFLKSAPTELTETLHAFHAQQYPKIDLIGVGRTVYYCPKPNCRHSAIGRESEDIFCKNHGDQMVAEGDLPNPS